MWQELALVHRPWGKSHGLLDGPGSIWATCLRQILFLPPGEKEKARVGAGDEAHVGLSAHRFLVEICSGLHSPLFGETEVFGQFRSFRESSGWHPAWQALLDAVEEDVKKLRRCHLKNLGSQSYGSLVRRHLPESGRVALVGAGRLARDLLPWLERHEVFLLARDPDKAMRDCPGIHPVLPLEAGLAGESRLTGAHWLIAAPVANSAFLPAWEKIPAGIVLDFRGEERFDPAPACTRAYFDLRSLYSQLAEVKLIHDRKRREAIEFAAELSRRREAEVWHRPYGWEDAFA